MTQRILTIAGTPLGDLLSEVVTGRKPAKMPKAGTFRRRVFDAVPVRGTALVRTVALALEEDSQRVRMVLAQLAKDGFIDRVDRGAYARKEAA